MIRLLCSRTTTHRMVAFVLLVSLLTGCAAPAVATATPTKTPRPAATVAPLPTATFAVPTLAPTVPPTVPPTVAPTEEPTATTAPTGAPAETATAAPVASAGNAGSGNTSGQPASSGSTDVLPARQPGVSIFTGLRPENPAVLERRPILLKVDNDLAVVPQSGFSKADVVVEHPKEGCLTRMSAIYQSQDAPRVGSIRSARLVDKELPVIFDAIVAFSGAVEPVRQALYKSDIGPQVLEQARNGSAFFRDPNIRVPFNLFANTNTIWNIGTQRGWNKAPNPTAAWVFSEGAPAGGKPATSLAIPYPKVYKQLHVGWVYDAGSGRWLRTLAGKPAIEKTDGSRLSAANVVVLTANVVQTLIPEQGNVLTTGPCSNASLEVQLWGQGPVRIFRDGKVYEGKWVRDGRRAPFRFVDAQGNDIPLKPGNSWWQIVASDMPVTVK